MQEDAFFKYKDKCKLLEEEQDIEILPKGLEVTLVRKVSNNWYANATVNGVPRLVLIRESNLEKIL